MVDLSESRKVGRKKVQPKPLTMMFSCGKSDLDAVAFATVECLHHWLRSELARPPPSLEEGIRLLDYVESYDIMTAMALTLLEWSTLGS